MSNKLYDVLKWIAIVFLPALTTFVGVILSSLSIENSDIILTIMTAFGTFLGTILGVSNIKYKNKESE